MNNNAPIREPAGDSWSVGWVQWFAQVVLGLGGWRKTLSKTVTYDFGSIQAQGELFNSFSVPGARRGDAVLVTKQSNVTGVIFTAEVINNDNINIHAKNFTGSAVDPTSDTFHIIVFQD